jgi:hypothetical protein
LRIAFLFAVPTVASVSKREMRADSSDLKHHNQNKSRMKLQTNMAQQIAIKKYQKSYANNVCFSTCISQRNQLRRSMSASSSSKYDPALSTPDQWSQVSLFKS